MNPLTQIKNTQKISKAEIAAGYTDSQSWHARFKHSAYIFTGGLPYGLTEGDLLAVFSQYGEIVDVNLVRHQDTGKSKGFAFLAYEDQRSTNLAVDNLNGAKVGGRIVTVDHVDNYKRKRAEMEGREESESGEEDAEVEVADPEAAEAAAIQAAMGDGAQIVSTREARVASSADAGPRGGNSAGGDAPWASKSSVFALLNSDLPAPPAAATGEEDPLLAMKKDKKIKKEKKAKKEKKDKDRKPEGLPDPGAQDAALQQQERPSRAEPDSSRRHEEPLRDHRPPRESLDRHADRSRTDRHRHRQASPRREPDRSREGRQHERRRH